MPQAQIADQGPLCRFDTVPLVLHQETASFKNTLVENRSGTKLADIPIFKIWPQKEAELSRPVAATSPRQDTVRVVPN